MGDIKLEKGSFDDARNYFIVSLVHCRKFSMRLSIAQCIQRLGDLLWKIDSRSLEDAQSCYLATQEILEPLGTIRHMADLVLRVGLAELWKGNMESALDKLGRATELYLEAEDDRNRAFCKEVVEWCSGKTHDEVRQTLVSLQDND